MPHFTSHERVDPRIPNCDVPKDKLRTAYFGTNSNMKHQQDLCGDVACIATPTHDASWMTSFADFNFHYGVRQSQAWDGFKPFGKGFIAARCGCPIIVSSIDQDAELYLGSDYPYLLKDDSLQNVRSVLEQVCIDFGNARWKVALDIMFDIRAKSTDDFVIREFAAVAKEYLTLK